MLYNSIMTTETILPSAGTPFTPDNRPGPWYAEYVGPPEKPPEQDLPLPAELADDAYSPLHEVLPELRERFDAYWNDRMNIIRDNGGMVVKNKRSLRVAEQRQREEQKDTIAEIGIYDEQDRRKAFIAEARFFHAVVSTIEAAHKEEDLNNIVVFFDIDETIAQIPTYGRPRLDIPGLTDRPYDTLDAEQKQQLRDVHAKAQYDDMVLRPGFELTVNYLMEKYGYNSQRLQFGLLTSHKQKMLAQYVLPRLQALCPGAFLEDGHGDNIISCNDGPDAEKLGRDVATLNNQPEEKDEAGRAIRVPLRDLVESYPVALEALDLDHISAQDTSFQETKLVIAADRVTQANNEIDHNTTVVLVDDWRSMELIHNGSPQWKGVKVHKTGSRFFVPGNYYHNFKGTEAA
jgi:hypothetical protein